LSSENHPIDDPVSSHNVLNNQININSRGKKEKQVTIKMKPREFWRYTPLQGMNKVLYDKVIFETVREPVPGVKNRYITQNVGDGQLNIMLTASAVNPDPLMRTYEEDIDRELTKLKVVSDSVSDNMEPNKLKGSICHQKHIGFVNDPGMDEIDSIRKHMANHRNCYINQVQYNRIQSHMDRYKELYKSPSNAQALPKFLEEQPERNKYTGFKEYWAAVAEW